MGKPPTAKTCRSHSFTRELGEGVHPLSWLYPLPPCQTKQDLQCLEALRLLPLQIFVLTFGLSHILIQLEQGLRATHTPHTHTQTLQYTHHTHTHIHTLHIHTPHTHSGGAVSCTPPSSDTEGRQLRVSLTSSGEPFRAAEALTSLPRASKKEVNSDV